MIGSVSRSTVMMAALVAALVARPPGPEVVHVLEVDPNLFGGMLAPKLATRIVPDREPLTSISARTGSLAAINGGYFVIGPNDGTPGDLAAISVLEGYGPASRREARPSPARPTSSTAVPVS